MSKNQSRKPTLKKRIGLTLLTGSVLLSLLGAGAVYHCYEPEPVPAVGVQYSSNEATDALAKLYNVDEYLCRTDDGEYVRFEAIEGTPIDVIVDEKSVWCMTDINIQAIKNSVDVFNDFFQRINPDIQFRYISKKEYEKNKTENSCILITSWLRVETAGGSARATTSQMDPFESKHGNGMVSNNATIILSSTGLVHLNVDEQASIFIHEIGHALGFQSHIDSKESIMNPYGKNEAIASDIMSKDLMYGLTALYYNSETSPYSLSEINNYIEKTHAERLAEIAENYTEDPTTNSEETTLSPIEDFDAKAKAYAKNHNIQLIKPIIDTEKTFSTTTIYGQTTTIKLSSDGTYSMTLTNSNGSTMTTTGTFTIENEFISCSGSIVSNDGGELHLEEKPMLIGLLEDNRIILYKDGIISCSLQQDNPSPDMTLE